MWLLLVLATFVHAQIDYVCEDYECGKELLTEFGTNCLKTVEEHFLNWDSIWLYGFRLKCEYDYRYIIKAENGSLNKKGWRHEIAEEEHFVIRRCRSQFYSLVQMYCCVLVLIICTAVMCYSCCFAKRNHCLFAFLAFITWMIILVLILQISHLFLVRFHHTLELFLPRIILEMSIIDDEKFICDTLMQGIVENVN